VIIHDPTHEKPDRGGAAGLDKTSSLLRRNDGPSNAPEIATAQVQIERNPRAVKQARLIATLAFQHWRRR
jgi:hypothetical protein